jgi:hypothetical protein
MVAALFVCALMQVSHEAELSRLGKARVSFDRTVLPAKSHELENRIYSMGPGEQHLYGFYPFGKADSRYLIATTNGGHAYCLLYQGIMRGKARTIWALRLRDTTKLGRVNGTLGTLLRRIYRAEIIGSTTKAERSALAKSQVLAGYGFNRIMMLYAWVVQKNGAETPVYFVPTYPDNAPYYPVLGEEANSLGLGDHSWPADLEYQPTGGVG